LKGTFLQYKFSVINNTGQLSRVVSAFCVATGTALGFTVNLGSDSLGKSNDLGTSSVSRIHFGFGFIVNPDPDPIIE